MLSGLSLFKAHVLSRLEAQVLSLLEAQVLSLLGTQEKVTGVITGVKFTT